MVVKTRERVCKTCPWRLENSHQLEIQNIRHMVHEGIISPCHQELEKVTGSPYTGVEKYAEQVPVFQVCRGFVIARASCTIPYVKPIWQLLVEELKFNDDPLVAPIKEVLRGNIGH